jgi:M6 family metalloprotease-like protein
MGVLHPMTLFSQIEAFECRTTGGGGAPMTTPRIVHAAMIYCFNRGEDTEIRSYLLTQPATRLSDYFSRATFGQVDFRLDAILRQDATHGIQSRVYFDFGRTFWHTEFTLDVLDQADSLFDFGLYDNDGPDGVPNSGDDDGSVDLLIFQLLNYAGSGIAGLQISTYTTNDPRNEGGFITINTSENGSIYVKQDQRDVTDIFDYLRAWCHELGHAMFHFPDMEHIGYDDYSHYATGAFDVMANGSFNRIPSPYNPFFVDVRGWKTFTSITSSIIDASISDFFAGGAAYKLQESPLSALAYPNERFYVTYHSKIFANTWTYNWPVKADTGGLLVWHSSENSVNMDDAMYYGNPRKMPIDLEAAHGKWIWTEHVDSVHNTGIPNPNTGLDSLEIRKVKINDKGHIKETQGPYYRKDHGTSSAFFFPNEAQEFAFYTNPNSNYYRNDYSEQFAHSVSSGFSLKDLTYVNGSAQLDMRVNDFTVTQDATLGAGTWYFTSTMNVSVGVTLTLAPSAVLKFVPGASLLVSGDLQVLGTSSQPVTFDVSGSGNWGGIHFQSGSGGSVSYANIKAATKGVRVTSSSPTIQNCTIEKFSEQGIYVTNGSPTIQTNTINGWSGSARVGTGIYVDNSGLGSSTVSVTGGNVIKGCIVGMSLEGPFGSVTQNTVGVYSGQASTSNTYGIIRYGGGTISNNKVYGDADDSYGISLRSGSGGAVAASQNLLDHHGMGLIDDGWQAGLVSNNSFTNNQISFVSSDGIMEAHNNDFWDSQSTSYNMWVLSEPPVYFDDNYLESWATSSDPKYYDCCSGNDPWYPPSASPNSAGPSWKVIQTKRPMDDLIANQTEAIPSGFGLTAYPNPFNPSTTVQIDLPEPAVVTLSIYDILGREVDRLLAGPLNAGVHRIEWNGTDLRGRQLSSGVYVIRLEAAERVFTHRVLFAK